MRVVEAEHRETVRIGQAFDAGVFERRDDVAAALLLPTRILDPLDPRDAYGAVAGGPEQRSAALLRIGRAAVLADRRDGPGVEPDHGASQNGSERYRPPPSQRIVTTVAGPSAISRATRRAASTLAAAEGPTRIPSSRARRRHIA